MSIVVKWEYKQESGHWTKSGWYEITCKSDPNNTYLLTGNSGANVYSFIHQKFEDERIVQEIINKNLDFALYHVDFEDSYHLMDLIDSNCQSKNDYEVTTIDFFYNEDLLLVKKIISYYYNEIDFVKYIYANGRLSEELHSNYDFDLLDVSFNLRDFLIKNDGIPSRKYEYIYEENLISKNLYDAESSYIIESLHEIDKLYEKDKFLINDSFLLFDKKQTLIDVQNSFFAKVKKLLDLTYVFSEKINILKPKALPASIDNFGRIIEERDDEKNIIYKFKYYD